jgi:hypothetical protein
MNEFFLIAIHYTILSGGFAVSEAAYGGQKRFSATHDKA